jgi:hypothetical protein
MAEPSAPDRSLPVQVAELWDLVRAYALQETVEPIKGLGRYAAMGIAGSLLLSIGLVELMIAALRALQTETDGWLDGQLSWAPYLIVLVIGALVMFLLLRATRRKRA